MGLYLPMLMMADSTILLVDREICYGEGNEDHKEGSLWYGTGS